MGGEPLNWNQELQTECKMFFAVYIRFPKEASVACSPHYPQMADKYLLSI